MRTYLGHTHPVALFRQFGLKAATTTARVPDSCDKGIYRQQWVTARVPLDIWLFLDVKSLTRYRSDARGR